MRYKEYKKVDIPWLDEVPSHWEISRIKNYTKVISSPLTKDICLSKGIYPIYDANKIIGYHNIINVSQPYISIIKDGAGVGRVRLLPQNSGILATMNGIIPDGININFLFRYLENFDFSNYINSTTIPHIYYNEYSKDYIPIPPKEEQEQIARFLYWKINEIDRLISIREKQIKNLEKTRRILIIDTMLNNDYKRVMLSRCVSENKRKNTNSYQNLLSLSYGKIIRKDINSSFGLLPEKFDKYQLVDKGNIILRLTDLQNDHKSLRVGLVKEKGIITSAYIGLICNDMVIPEYLYYYLNAMDLRKDFYSIGAGVRQNLNYNELRKINIKLPDKDTQKYIIDYLNENEIRIKKIIKSKEKQINNLKPLKKSLISDVVTGKIDVRNVVIPEYEKVSDIEDDKILEDDFNEEV